MTVIYVHSDITTDNADILVNPVNCVGIAGKGVALAFKNRWPEIMTDYQAVCVKHSLIPGGCLLFPHPEVPGLRFWAALATKNHWRDPSRYEWIESGLNELAKLAHLVKAHSIAIPPVGCGNGGLDWNRVHPMILTTLSDFYLRIYGSPP